MKTPQSIAILQRLPSSCALVLFLAAAVPGASAQAPAAPAPPATPVPRLPPLPPPAPPLQPGEEDQIIERKVTQRRSGGGAAISVEPMGPGADGGYASRVWNSSTKPSRNLVIQFSASDPEVLARAEEDLAIMARILDKAARTRRDDDRLVMGINVDGSVFGSSSGARNIYVEGHGALFLLGVKYPLIAPPEKPQEPRAKDTTSDEWKRAREEVAAGGASGGSGGGEAGQIFGYAMASGPGGAIEEFDEDRVNELKDALIGALRNASHLRMVKPDEFITVVVQGADSGAVTKTTRDGKGNVRVTSTAGAGGGSRRSESVLTLRVKKSDADAFADGRLDPDAFRKTISTQSYLRRPFAAAVPEMFNLPVVR